MCDLSPVILFFSRAYFPFGIETGIRMAVDRTIIRSIY
jgi:hypothetical protein